MAFYSRTFMFGGIPSETYGLIISSDDGGEGESPAPASVELRTQKLFRRNDEYLLGVTVPNTLEFSVRFMSEKGEISADEFELISRWLFGRVTYKDLVVFQPDMTEIIFPCFFLDPQIIRNGNLIVGVSATAHCRTAWGMTKEREYNFSFTPPLSDYLIKHTNSSDDTGYTYPILIITMDVNSGDLSIRNSSDNDRITTITGLLSGEVLTLDCDKQMISSSTGQNRLSVFNKKFFRLKQGLNNIYLTGNIASLKIKYANARKIGG